MKIAGLEVAHRKLRELELLAILTAAALAGSPASSFESSVK